MRCRVACAAATGPNGLSSCFGFAAVAISLGFLVFLLGTMLWKGAGGLTLDFLQASDSTDRGDGRRLGSAQGKLPDDRRHDGARLPSRGAVGDLP